MEPEAKTFDAIWEDSLYSQGLHLNRYPFDAVVTFVYRNCPKDRARRDVRVLEVGCGAGNNLWFMAREGFEVVGIDGSPSAVATAAERFAKEGLVGDFRVGDFTQLPFDDGSFDLAVDRCAITCTGFAAASKAVSEVHRVLRPGGRFFFNPYSDRHTSRDGGTLGPDGVTIDIRRGTLTGVGQLCFYGRRDIDAILGVGWQLLSLQHLETIEFDSLGPSVHAEWRVVVERQED